MPDLSRTEPVEGPSATRSGSVTRAVMLLVCGAAVAIGTALRVIAARTEMWLDERWTVAFTREITHFSDVLLSPKLRHSNIHPLDAWYLWAIQGITDACRGAAPTFIEYRLHSLLAGAATIVLAALIARRRGRLEAMLAACLTAGSYLLIHFSSQARGYALMLCFAFGALLALQRYLDAAGGRWRRALLAAAFSMCVVLGLLSHLMFVQFVAAAALWAGVVLWRRFGVSVGCAGPSSRGRYRSLRLPHAAASLPIGETGCARVMPIAAPTTSSSVRALGKMATSSMVPVKKPPIAVLHAIVMLSPWESTSLMSSSMNVSAWSTPSR